MSKKKSDSDNTVNMKSIPRVLEEQLIKFIDDCSRGLIFTSSQINSSSMNIISSIFMPLMFMDISKEAANDIGIIWEYYDQAGPRSINGYPCFFSMHIMHKDDWAIALKFLQDHEAQKKLAISNYVKKEI